MITLENASKKIMNLYTNVTYKQSENIFLKIAWNIPHGCIRKICLSQITIYPNLKSTPLSSNSSEEISSFNHVFQNQNINYYVE